MRTNEEIDLLVAEHLFDFKLKVLTSEISAPANWVSPPGSDRTWVKFDGFEQAPKYSTDITQAMKVLEVLRNSGKFCCLEIHSDYHYIWTVRLTKENWSQDGSKHEPSVMRSDESLPMAICKAALETRGVHV